MCFNAGQGLRDTLIQSVAILPMTWPPGLVYCRQSKQGAQHVLLGRASPVMKRKFMKMHIAVSLLGNLIAGGSIYLHKWM